MCDSDKNHTADDQRLRDKNHTADDPRLPSFNCMHT